MQRDRNQIFRYAPDAATALIEIYQRSGRPHADEATAQYNS